MKIPLLLAGLILVSGAVIAWQDQNALRTLRIEQQALAAEANGLGISIDPENPRSGSTTTKRLRDDQAEETRQLVAKVIATAKEMKQAQEAGNESDLDSHKRGIDLMTSLMDLPPSQLKAFIAGIRDAKDLDDEMRQGLIGFSIMMLAESSPSTALAIFTESADLLENSSLGTHIITSSLNRWASEDPMAALEWIRKNSEKHPDIITDETKRGIIEGTAKNDPALAFQLISELEFKDASSAFNSIASAATTPEARSAALEALRTHLTNLKDPNAAKTAENTLLRGLAGSFRTQNFEQSADWLASAALSPSEAKAFSEGLHYRVTHKDSGKWISWIAENTEPDKNNNQIQNIVRNWTEDDFHAAGTWLAQAPDDAAKVPAVKAYVSTIASYEPETAEQWALTLPAGTDRVTSLKKIHDSWPKEDQEGRSAFAERHQIK